MKMGQVFVNKETGEEIKIILIGSDGRVAVEFPGGKKGGLSQSELQKDYTEKGATPAKAEPKVEKPAAKNETKKPIVKKEAPKIKAVVEKLSSGEAKENFLKELKKVCPKVGYEENVHWTSVVTKDGVAVRVRGARAKVHLDIDEDLLSEHFGGAAYNKKKEFVPYPHNEKYVRYTINSEAQYPAIMEYLKKILLVK